MDDWLNYMLYLYVEYAVSSDSQDNRIKNAWFCMHKKLDSQIAICRFSLVGWKGFDAIYPKSNSEKLYNLWEQP
jgi:hypothetical protein